MDDLEFIQRCISRDEHSWDQFVDRYSRLIYNYIHGVLKLKGISHLNPENINDLFQEIFFSLVKDDFKKLRSYKARNGCSFASWLRQVVINSSIDYLRRNNVVMASLDAEDDEGLKIKDILMDDKASVREILADKDMFEHLKECIEDLDTDDKYFLELYVNQTMDLKELKDILKISRGAADMRRVRIINRLKDCFRAKGFVC